MSDEEKETIEAIEEQVIEQRIIPFEGDELAAARGQSGSVFVSIPGLCRALGMNAQGQTRRISRTKSLAKGLRQIPLKTPKRGVQLTYCLRLDRVALWLAGIETDRLKPEYQGKIEAYQDDLAEVANGIFFRHLNITEQTETSLTADESLYSILNLLVDHLSALASMPMQLDQVMNILLRLTEQQTITASAVSELTSHITAAQKEKIANAVNTIVRDSQKMNHQQVYVAIHHQFCVAKYDDIPQARFEDVMTFLRELWKQSVSEDRPAQGELF